MENVARPCWPASASRPDDQAGVQATRQQAPDGHVGHQPALHGDAQRREHRVLPVPLGPVGALLAPGEVGFPICGGGMAPVGFDRHERWPAAAWSPRAESCAAAAPRSGRTDSGAGRRGRCGCRRRRRRAVPAGTTRTGSGAASSVTYSGLTPNRSRPSSTRPLSRSTSANANMPLRWSTKRSPQW